MHRGQALDVLRVYVSTVCQDVRQRELRSNESCPMKRSRQPLIFGVDVQAQLQKVRNRYRLVTLRTAMEHVDVTLVLGEWVGAIHNQVLNHSAVAVI